MRPTNRNKLRSGSRELRFGSQLDVAPA